MLLQPVANRMSNMMTKVQKNWIFSKWRLVFHFCLSFEGGRPSGTILSTNQIPSLLSFDYVNYEFWWHPQVFSALFWLVLCSKLCPKNFPKPNKVDNIHKVNFVILPPFSIEDLSTYHKNIIKILLSKKCIIRYKKIQEYT